MPPIQSGPPHTATAIALMNAYPELSGNLSSVLRWLDGICYSRANRWMYAHVGKTASSTMLRALFHIEFGHALTVRAERQGDINPNVAMHALTKVGLFQSGQNPHSDMLGFLQKDPVRIVSVRHPSDRALSFFRYICLANEKGSDQFLADRLRMNAGVGFDWNADPGTLNGFRKFLIALNHAFQRTEQANVNRHYALQTPNLLIGKFEYDVQVRAEDLAGGIEAICDRLDLHPQPILDDLGHANQTSDIGREWLQQPDIRRLLIDLYGPDYEALNYDP